MNVSTIATYASAAVTSAAWRATRRRTAGDEEAHGGQAEVAAVHEAHGPRRRAAVGELAVALLAERTFEVAERRAVGMDNGPRLGRGAGGGGHGILAGMCEMLSSASRRLSRSQPTAASLASASLE